MIRVLLVDDHVMIRAGLERLLEQDPGIEVVGVADRGTTALELDSELQPDVVVMDISMPDMDGIETTRRLVGERAQACVVMLTAHTDRERVLDAVDAGALGYLVKDADPATLLAGIHSAANGDAPVDPRAARANDRCSGQTRRPRTHRARDRGVGVGRSGRSEQSDRPPAVDQREDSESPPHESVRRVGRHRSDPGSAVGRRARHRRTGGSGCGPRTKVQWPMRPLVRSRSLHVRVRLPFVCDATPWFRRISTRLSEGVLVTENGQTSLHVVGGPPFANLDVFAARERIGSITLNHLGAGSIPMNEAETGAVSSTVPIALRHGECTLLKGYLGSPGAVGLTTGGRR